MFQSWIGSTWPMMLALNRNQMKTVMSLSESQLWKRVRWCSVLHFNEDTYTWLLHYISGIIYTIFTLIGNLAHLLIIGVGEFDLQSSPGNMLTTFEVSAPVAHLSGTVKKSIRPRCPIRCCDKHGVERKTSDPVKWSLCLCSLPLYPRYHTWNCVPYL